MTFDEAFADAPIGASVAVSNGQPKPPAKQELKNKVWRSHNFSGPIEAKIDATEDRPRRIRINAVTEPGLSVSYEIEDGQGHSFEFAEG